MRGGVVIATPVRLPSQFYLSIQHSSPSVRLPPCLSVCYPSLPPSQLDASAVVSHSKQAYQSVIALCLFL